MVNPSNNLNNDALKIRKKQYKRTKKILHQSNLTYNGTPLGFQARWTWLRSFLLKMHSSIEYLKVDSPERKKKGLELLNVPPHIPETSIKTSRLARRITTDAIQTFQQQYKNEDQLPMILKELSDLKFQFSIYIWYDILALKKAPKLANQIDAIVLFIEQMYTAASNCKGTTRESYYEAIYGMCSMLYTKIDSKEDMIPPQALDRISTMISYYSCMCNLSRSLFDTNYYFVLKTYDESQLPIDTFITDIMTIHCAMNGTQNSVSNLVRAEAPLMGLVISLRRAALSESIERSTLSKLKTSFGRAVKALNSHASTKGVYTLYLEFLQTLISAGTTSPDQLDSYKEKLERWIKKFTTPLKNISSENSLNLALISLFTLEVLRVKCGYKPVGMYRLIGSPPLCASPNWKQLLDNEDQLTKAQRKVVHGIKIKGHGVVNRLCQIQNQASQF